MKWAVKMHELLIECRDAGIETMAIGYKKVHSAALLPYLSCIYRIAREDVKFLIHRSKSINGVQNDDHLIGEKEFFEYFAQVTTASVKEFFQFAENDTYLSYNEALKMKIVNFDWIKKCLPTG